MSDPEVKTYEFDADFQSKIAALTLRDGTFNDRAEGLVEPAYFQNEAQAMLVKIALGYFKKYRQVPQRASLAMILKEAKSKKIIPDSLWPDLLEQVKEVMGADISDRDFVLDTIADFAKHQAIENAILKSATLIDKRDFDGIEKAMRSAMDVGSVMEDAAYNYFGEIESRTAVRKDVVAGLIKPDGITTGFKEIDDLLYNKGWGRKELSVIMGAAKAGKSMALISFAIKAALAGYKVLYLSLEVSRRIVADRMDANIANVRMNDLPISMGIVRDRVHKAQATGAGMFDVRDYPSGSLRPMEVRRMLKQHLARGIQWDLVVIDYADLMAPDTVSTESRENSRSIYVGLRAIAHELNVSVLSATQTNREGFKAAVGKMEHVAEDINKARTVDLLLSINSQDDEKERGETRVYFAASRNQKSGMSVLVQGDFEKAQFVNKVLDIT